MLKYLAAFLMLLLIFLSCQSNPDKKAEEEYSRLEKQWLSVEKAHPDEKVLQQWINKFWAFRNEYMGTGSATKATIRTFELSRLNLDFKGIETKYRQLSVNDNALAELPDFIRMAAPLHDESPEWNRIIEKTTNKHVKISAMYYLAAYYFQFNFYEKCDSLLNALSDKYLVGTTDPNYGKEIASMKEKISKLSVGNFLPNFNCFDLSGNIVELDKLKGKVVLMFFYGSGCGSCVKTYPTLNKLYSKYKNDNFYLLGISVDKETKYEKYFYPSLKKYGIHWPQTFDYKLFGQYNINALSTSLLVDKDGRLVLISRAGETVAASEFLKNKSIENSVRFLLNL